ncbi:trimeric LpxA-like protein [Podospora fimiseda]|uniref:Trimeric LpxA-like protein n=1 Tax=Podospora fimiseda TaxID=252190 RepID=A0AAN7GZX8_9PEZI|nr:trimeric LpxA-like protein [Podospora fimiseda]
MQHLSQSHADKAESGKNSLSGLPKNLAKVTRKSLRLTEHNITQRLDSPKIHPTSLIHPFAKISSSVQIGPFCFIGPNVSIDSHIIISGHTKIGSNCTIHPHSVLGGPSQAIADSDSSFLTIGDYCTIREHVTINLGTEATSIGNNCLIMANVHVAHDCHVGDNVILVNGVLLAGHVEVGKGAIISGEYAFLGAKTVASRDVLPFSMVKGYRGRTVGVNVVGLRRRGWGEEERIKRVEKGVVRGGK